MDELGTFRVFVEVVEQGSYSAAARNENVSVSSVARQIKTLEDRLGVRLLNKTTRQQSLTEAGALFFQRAKDILDQIDRARREVSSFQRSIKGLLRVSLRTSAGNAVIVPALPRFLEEHPDLRLEVALTDERLDLVGNGIDVAVWLGHLDDSSMVARRLSPSHRVVCGAPSYFERHGEPVEPPDLGRHNCLVYLANNYGDVWRFTRGVDRIDVPVCGNLRTPSGSVLLSAALGGLGIMVVQRWMVRRALESGRLKAVLTAYDVSPTGDDTALYAVYPHARGMSPKARVFVDFLVRLFQDGGR